MSVHALRPSRAPLRSGISWSGGPRSWTRRLGPFSAAFRALLKWQDLAFERAALRTLDDRQLGDVGLTRADIVAELAKPFWHRR